MRNIIITIIFTLVYFMASAQSPWVREKGKGFIQASYTTIPEYNKFFPGGILTTNTYNDRTYQLYAEYGISDKITIIGVGAYKHEKSISNALGGSLFPSGELSGFSNPSLSFRYRLSSKKLISAAQLTIDAPINNTDTLRGLSTGFNAITILPMYSIGRGFNENNYAYGYAGYAIRTNGFNHYIRMGGEAGHRFFDQLWVVFFLDLNYSMQNSTIYVTDAQRASNFYVPNQEYLAYGLKIIEELNDNFGITAGFGGSFWGHHVAASPALSIGFYYK